MQYSSDIKRSISTQLISINSCGELRVDVDSHIRRYDGRSDYQLIYICDGQCVVTLEGSVHIAYPGDCIIYRPGEIQDYLYTKKIRTHTYWIHFTGDVCKKMIEMFSLQNVYIVNAQHNSEIKHMISKVCQYYNLEIPNRELICSGLMQSILALLSNEVHKEIHHTKEKNKDKISELISRIKMTPNLNFTVSECAEFCHMSKPHFARVFKRTTGMPPVQFILGIRIERAKELLDFTNMPVTEIAEASGFYDQNYFARTFKKITGVSPTQYRHADKT